MTITGANKEKRCRKLFCPNYRQHPHIRHDEPRETSVKVTGFPVGEWKGYLWNRKVEWSPLHGRVSKSGRWNEMKLRLLQNLPQHSS